MPCTSCNTSSRVGVHLKGLRLVWQAQQKVPHQQAILGWVLSICQQQLLQRRKKGKVCGFQRL